MTVTYTEYRHDKDVFSENIEMILIAKQVRWMNMEGITKHIHSKMEQLGMKQCFQNM